jgi:hypothetical protein
VTAARPRGFGAGRRSRPGLKRCSAKAHVVEVDGSPPESFPVPDRQGSRAGRFAVCFEK